ncbi:MAG: hypothetical protein SGJ27_06785 [Candidatus Melainabacteria bacterium]|nr:hypothetical protein [Candidatus Melainabacteria bacterium]
MNSAQFAKLFNIASSTSLNMLKKIMMVVVNELSAHSTVNSSEFEDAISRRSAETPVNQHPRSEIQVETSIVEDLVSPLIEKLDVCELGIFKLLEVDKPLSSDQLLIRGALTSGELALSLLNLKSLGLVKFLPGDLYARDKPPAPPICDGAQSSRVLKFTGIIIETYQGISRKYLQLYLCAVWIFTDRKRWGQGSLIAACSKAAEIKDSQVRAYVSPPSVRIP